MNRFNFLSLNEMKLEAFDENREEYQAFSDRKTPSWALALSSKAERLVSHAWNLLDVFLTETIRIKPEKDTWDMLSAHQDTFKKMSLTVITNNNLDEFSKYLLFIKREIVVDVRLTEQSRVMLVC